MGKDSHSSDSEEQTNPRKRSRKTLSAEEDNGSSHKKRGRPRVDTQDATAADRRRTQIRLAQRAYRQRKESTISSLKKQVSGLESVVEQMNKTLLQFNDSAINSGILALRPQLAKELQAATEMFGQLAQDTAANASQDDDQEGIEDVQPEPTVSEPQAPPQNNIAMPPTPNFAQPEHDQLDMGFGYARMFQGREYDLHQRDVISSYLSGLPTDPLPPPPSHHQSHHHQDLLPFGLISHDQHTSYHVNNVSTPSPKHVPSPYGDNILATPCTYSFQETTFARRLQRYSIERAYQLVSSKAYRPGRYEKVFRLSLLTAPHEEIAGRFQALLKRGQHESLEFWETPFIHLGGAGTHYPRRDVNGNVLPILNGWTVRRIGPIPYRGLLMDDKGHMRDIELDLREFQGDWFDAHDVQGYLEEKGCRIDPQSSFADALLDAPLSRAFEDVSGPLAMDLGMMNNTAMSLAPPRSRSGSLLTSVDGNRSASLTSGHSGSYPRSESTGVHTPNSTNDGQPETGFGFGSGMMGAMNMDGFYNMSFPMKPNKPKRSVTIDVQKLCEELVNRCMCLGRSPGFRPNDVDAAFNASIISAY
ncbi:hypothetical protein EJ05DRAFT_485671 [Pseudovirgaria hyperparasitica]|uniref:BZIP domain-containing protein n=1 Tax=Pseudovirgaria hyperparasitica TaxID=470096 RepID=A0A6A6WAD7_9PEZI|nr:uncharacterized protein EJ05DRAFT_485671 [Pseudovirgaria hyperparasitica]KAF2758557.1 hypothetical protein EJ05DRAFT_485671 [Pseudovirgaria hyperparasitica]